MTPSPPRREQRQRARQDTTGASGVAGGGGVEREAGSAEIRDDKSSSSGIWHRAFLFPPKFPRPTAAHLLLLLTAVLRSVELRSAVLVFLGFS